MRMPKTQWGRSWAPRALAGVVVFALIGMGSMGIPPPPKDPPPQEAQVLSSWTPSTPTLQSTAVKSSLLGKEASIPGAEIVPSVLMFKNSPICVPSIETIQVVNTAEDAELQIHGLESSDQQFHPAVFKPQVLQPGERTSVQIIYLPRYVGQVESSITVATSAGDIRCPIDAFAVKNPYRLHAFVGTKLPLGVLYTRPIIIHNPFNEVLHVLDISTSVSFLHLHLPEGEAVSNSALSGSWGGQPPANGSPTGGGSSNGGPATSSQEVDSGALWQVPPKGEKEVIQLRFRADKPGVHVGYVHVKTDRDRMVIPVEVEVLQGGLHPAPKELDFGILTSPEEHRAIPISLFNSGNDPVALTGVSFGNSDDNMTAVFPAGAVIPPGGTAQDLIKLVFFGTRPGSASGRVMLTTNHSNAGISVVDVQYQAMVLHGGVGYERRHVSFVVPASNNSHHGLDMFSGGNKPVDISRSVAFTNFFKVPLVLRSAVMETCGDVLSVTTSAVDVVAWPSEQWPSVNMHLSAKHALRTLDLPHVCLLKLGTNASTHHIPVPLYTGRLHLTASPDTLHAGCGPATKASVSRASPPSSGSSSTPSSSSSQSPPPLPPPLHNEEQTTAGFSGDSAAPLDMLPTPILDQRAPLLDSAGRCPKSTEDSRSGGKMGLVLDYGSVGAGHFRVRSFNVTNLNPVPVNVTLSAVDEEVLGCRLLGQQLFAGAGTALMEIYQETASAGGLPSEGASLTGSTNSPQGGTSAVGPTVSPSTSGGGSKNKERKRSRSGKRKGKVTRSLESLGLSKAALTRQGDFTIFPAHSAQFELFVRARTPGRGSGARGGGSPVVVREAAVMTTPVDRVPIQVTYSVLNGTYSAITRSISLSRSVARQPLIMTSTFDRTVNVSEVRSERGHWIQAHALVPTIDQASIIAEIVFQPKPHCQHLFRCVYRWSQEVIRILDTPNLREVASTSTTSYLDAAAGRPEGIEGTRTDLEAVSGAITTLMERFEWSLPIQPRDVELYQSLVNTWSTLSASGFDQIHSLITVETDVGAATSPIVATASLALEHPVVSIDIGPGGHTTQVGEVRSVYFKVTNPSSVPAQVQLDSLAGDPQVLRGADAPTPSTPWWDIHIRTVSAGSGRRSSDKELGHSAVETDGQQAEDGSVVVGGGDVGGAIGGTSGRGGIVQAIFELVDKETGEVQACGWGNGTCHYDRWLASGEATEPSHLPSLGGRPSATAVATAAAAVAVAEDPESLPPFFLSMSASRLLALAPGQSAVLGPVLFRPPRPGTWNTSIFLRNNLTMLEEVKISMQGGSGAPFLRTSDGAVHSPGSIPTLWFHLNASHWRGTELQDVNTTSTATSTPTTATADTSSPSSMGALETASVGDADASRTSGWPRPASHVVQLENHGDLPLHVSQVRIGDQHCSTSSGFAVEGCESLPITLGPKQAWRVGIHYYTDCVSMNELQSLTIVTNVGTFDAILHAITDPMDMADCENARLENLDSQPIAFVRLFAIVAGLLGVIWSTRELAMNVSGVMRSTVLPPTSNGPHHARPNHTAKPGRRGSGRGQAGLEEIEIKPRRRRGGGAVREDSKDWKFLAVPGLEPGYQPPSVKRLRAKRAGKHTSEPRQTTVRQGPAGDSQSVHKAAELDPSSTDKPGMGPVEQQESSGASTLPAPLRGKKPKQPESGNKPDSKQPDRNPVLHPKAFAPGELQPSFNQISSPGDGGKAKPGTLPPTGTGPSAGGSKAVAAATGGGTSRAPSGARAGDRGAVGGLGLRGVLPVPSTTTPAGKPERDSVAGDGKGKLKHAVRGPKGSEKAPSTWGVVGRGSSSEATPPFQRSKTSPLPSSSTASPLPSPSAPGAGAAKRSSSPPQPGVPRTDMQAAGTLTGPGSSLTPPGLQLAPRPPTQLKSSITLPTAPRLASGPQSQPSGISAAGSHALGGVRRSGGSGDIVGGDTNSGSMSVAPAPASRRPTDSISTSPSPSPSPPAVKLQPDSSWPSQRSPPSQEEQRDAGKSSSQQARDLWPGSVSWEGGSFPPFEPGAPADPSPAGSLGPAAASEPRSIPAALVDRTASGGPALAGAAGNSRVNGEQGGAGEGDGSGSFEPGPLFSSGSPTLFPPPGFELFAPATGIGANDADVDLLFAGPALHQPECVPGNSEDPVFSQFMPLENMVPARIPRSTSLSNSRLVNYMQSEPRGAEPAHSPGAPGDAPRPMPPLPAAAGPSSPAVASYHKKAQGSDFFGMGEFFEAPDEDTGGIEE